MRYLGIPRTRPRVGVFDFTGCEGCELQLANREETLVPFLRAIEIVEFREISSDPGGGALDVAFIEGCISRSDEVARLREIRARAATVVALGSCACFGGVSALKNAVDTAEAVAAVYGEHDRETRPARPIGEWVDVDLRLPGCPVSKRELERLARHLVLGVPFRHPHHPVCWDCKQRFTVCSLDLGELCLGPITRGGCGAPCPAGGLACWGCRGPASDCNMESFLAMARERRFPEDLIAERIHFFGAFEDRYETP